jgi:hypothetical protein
MLEDLKVCDLMKLAKLFGESNDNISKDYSGYKIIRTYSAGVFAGNIISRNGKEVILKNAIRLWQWSGAASLSQLAMEGVKNPDNCKFAMSVDKIELLEVIEILDCTLAAENSIKSVPSWKK